MVLQIDANMSILRNIKFSFPCEKKFINFYKFFIYNFTVILGPI